MRSVCAPGLAPSSEIGGSLSIGLEGGFRRGLAGDVCRVVWPKNTDAYVGSIADCSTRAARDYLNGKVALPPAVIAAIVVAITRRS